MSDSDPGAIGVLLNDLQLGGCERVAIRLANAWAAMGWRVILYVAHDIGSLRSMIAGNVVVKFADPPLTQPSLQALRLGWWAGRQMAADGVTRCLLPGNSQFNGAVAVRLATRGRIPVYAKISNPLWRSDRPWLSNVLFCSLARVRLAGVAGLAALSPRLLRHDDAAIGLGGRARVLPDALGGAWSEAQVPRRPFHLCAAGRMAPQKNFALALHAMALLHDLPVTLSLVGDGPQLPQLRRLARELGLDSRVRFVGAVPDCTPYMAEAEALLCTSLFEGYPAVMVEALTLGTYLITTRSSCAVDDIVQSPLLGRVADEATPEGVAAAVRAFFNSPERHQSAARRERARALFAAHLDATSAREYLGFMRPA